MTLGEKLQELRRKAGLSQEAMADRLEVSRQAVSKWERDEAMPETEKLIRIAQLFDVSLDGLLLDRDAAEAPAASQKPCARPSAAQQWEGFLRRSGKKAGRICVILGLVLCLLSVAAYLLWPVLAGQLLWLPMNVVTNVTEEFTWEFDTEGSGLEGLPDDAWNTLWDAQYGPHAAGGSFGGIMDSAAGQMNSALNQALRLQATQFLIGVIPGLGLIAAGIYLILKGRKLEALE